MRLSSSLLACAALLLVGSSCVSAALPSDFFYGSATAAYQIEGSWDVDGKQPSEWDLFSHLPGKIANGDNGDVADNSYVMWKDDIALLVATGVNSYRFSLSWSRIIDADGNINPVGVAHYNNIINALIENNIEPLVTIYHWDLPIQYGTMMGESNRGWLNSTYIIPLYMHYANAVFSSFGDRVKNWIIFNEPHTFCVQGFAVGAAAPGRCSNRTQCTYGDSSVEPYTCAHTVVLAFSAVANLWRDTYEPMFGKGKVGISLDAIYGVPLTDSAEDAAAAERYMIFQLSWWADPLFLSTHDYPEVMRELVGDRLPQFTAEDKASLATSVPDFFAYNYYTAAYIYAETNDTDPFTRDQQAGITRINPEGEVIGEQGASSWLYIVPWAFPKALQWIADRYDSPPIMVTENGLDIAGESSLPLPQVLNDQTRVDYLTLHLGNMTEVAVDQNGINMIGYFVWSLLDNFEWADGYTKRFGIHYVDYANGCTRYTKDSAKYYAQWIAEQQAETKEAMQAIAGL